MNLQRIIFICSCRGDDDDGQTAEVKKERPETVIQTLKEMFPNKSDSEIESSLESHGSYSKAVNHLLATASTELPDTNDDDDVNNRQLLDSIFLAATDLPIKERLRRELKDIEKKNECRKGKT